MKLTLMFATPGLLLATLFWATSQWRLRRRVTDLLALNRGFTRRRFEGDNKLRARVIASMALMPHTEEAIESAAMTIPGVKSVTFGDGEIIVRWAYRVWPWTPKAKVDEAMADVEQRLLALMPIALSIQIEPV